MKKNIFLSILFLISSFLYAQTDTGQKYLLTTKTNTLGMTMLNLIDPYLSPLPYSGIGFIYNHESSRFLSLQNTNVSMQSKTNVVAGLALNPAFTASMTYLGLNYGWGRQYHFRPLKDLQVRAGGLWDIDFGFKSVLRNVNNPVNIDIATNLNLTGVAIYDIATRNKLLKLRLDLSTPVLGCMFVPRGGASYYELFELGNLAGTTHFSSLHNKRGIHGILSVDIPFNHSVWRYGISYQGLKYSANEMVFKRNEISIIVGTTFDVITFAGRKNRAPANFISTDE